VELTTGILVFPGVEELDFVGPWEVFKVMRMLLEADDRVVTIAQSRECLECAKGLRILPDHDFEDAPALDVLIVPGGLGTRTERSNKVLVDWLRKVGESSSWVTSVCTGALLLYEADFLRGKRVTTHWSVIGVLRDECGLEVVEGVRFVHDGKVVTSAGVSAGIDMALWLVGQLRGIEVARRVQHWMEYQPMPPYAPEPVVRASLE